MKRKKYSSSLIEIYRKNFIRNHSKFIHGSPFTLEDLDQDKIVEGKNFKIVGMNDSQEIVFREEESGDYFVVFLKDWKKIYTN